MYEFDAELWLHDGEAAWTFVTVPGPVSDDIESRTEHRHTAFGSVRVRVTVGATSWATSVFPDRGREAYVLPVKKEVRRRESLTVGDVVTVRLDIVDV